MHLNRLRTVPKVAKAAKLGALTGILPAITSAAIGSILGSANAINQHETRQSARRRITLEEANPEMARSKAAKQRGSAMVLLQRKRRNSKSNVRMTQAPVTMGGITRNPVPIMSSNARGLVVTHSENISTLPLTAAGVLNYFTLAIIPSLFPYLNGVASNFGKYKWTKLHIRYVPACPATTEGESAFGLYFDRQDAVAATFTQVTSMHKAVSFPPWGGFTGAGTSPVSITVDCNEFDKNRYSYMTIANFTALSASDENNYCPVSLATATQGSTAGAPVGGRIWVDYSIQLTDPIVPGLNT